MWEKIKIVFAVISFILTGMAVVTGKVSLGSPTASLGLVILANALYCMFGIVTMLYCVYVIRHNWRRLRVKMGPCSEIDQKQMERRWIIFHQRMALVAIFGFGVVPTLLGLIAEFTGEVTFAVMSVAAMVLIVPFLMISFYIVGNEAEQENDDHSN